MRIAALPTRGAIVLGGVVLLFAFASLEVAPSKTAPSLSGPQASRLEPLSVLATLSSDQPTVLLQVKRNEPSLSLPAGPAAQASSRAAILPAHSALPISAGPVPSAPLPPGP